MRVDTEKIDGSLTGKHTKENKTEVKEVGENFISLYKQGISSKHQALG